MKPAMLPACAALVLLGAAARAARRRPGELADRSTPEEVDGIPFRLKETYVVRVLQRVGDGEDKTGVYKEVHRSLQNLPDMDHVYVLGVDADGLSDHTLDVKLHPDGTLSTVDLKGVELHGDEVLTALGAQVKSLSTAVGDFDKTKQDAEKARLESKKALEDAERSLLNDRLSREKAALSARLDAERQIEALEKLRAGGTATAAQVSEQERVVTLAKQDANDKARLAGMSVPYP